MPVVADKYRGSKEYLLVYSELIRAARYRGTTTYQAISEIMGLPLRGSYMGKEVGQMLGEIVEDEFNQGRPMLTAIVVGGGWFTWSGFLCPGQRLWEAKRRLKRSQAALLGRREAGCVCHMAKGIQVVIIGLSAWLTPLT
jgi:hypothetical protein